MSTLDTIVLPSSGLVECIGFIFYIINCYTFQLRYQDFLLFAEYEQYFMSHLIQY